MQEWVEQAKVLPPQIRALTTGEEAIEDFRWAALLLICGRAAD